MAVTLENVELYRLGDGQAGIATEGEKRTVAVPTDTATGAAAAAAAMTVDVDGIDTFADEADAKAAMVASAAGSNPDAFKGANAAQAQLNARLYLGREYAKGRDIRAVSGGRERYFRPTGIEDSNGNNIADQISYDELDEAPSARMTEEDEARYFGDQTLTAGATGEYLDGAGAWNVGTTDEQKRATAYRHLLDTGLDDAGARRALRDMEKGGTKPDAVWAKVKELHDKNGYTGTEADKVKERDHAQAHLAKYREPEAMAEVDSVLHKRGAAEIPGLRDKVLPEVRRREESVRSAQVQLAAIDAKIDKAKTIGDLKALRLERTKTSEALAKAVAGRDTYVESLSTALSEGDQGDLADLTGGFKMTDQDAARLEHDAEMARGDHVQPKHGFDLFTGSLDAGLGLFKSALEGIGFFTRDPNYDAKLGSSEKTREQGWKPFEGIAEEGAMRGKTQTEMGAQMVLAGQKSLSDKYGKPGSHGEQIAQGAAGASLGGDNRPLTSAFGAPAIRVQLAQAEATKEQGEEAEERRKRRHAGETARG